MIGWVLLIVVVGIAVYLGTLALFLPISPPARRARRGAGSPPVRPARRTGNSGTWTSSTYAHGGSTGYYGGDAGSSGSCGDGGGGGGGDGGGGAC